MPNRNQKKQNKVPRLVIRFNLKKALPRDARVGSKVPEALDKKVSEMLNKAFERMKQNKRTTILPQDL